MPIARPRPASPASSCRIMEPAISTPSRPRSTRSLKSSKGAAGRVPVLLDGGVRRGTDIAKALAWGATAVMIGRPYLYGLAVAGAEGVSAVVGMLRSELESTLALTGRNSVAELDRTVLWDAGSAERGALGGRQRT